VAMGGTVCFSPVWETQVSGRRDIDPSQLLGPPHFLDPFLPQEQPTSWEGSLLPSVLW
jgi:hypothetical protein